MVSKIGLRLDDLDESTRELMDEELKMDRDAHKVYFSPRLSEKGEQMYQNLLENAILYGNDQTLANDLKKEDALKVKEKRMLPVGGIFLADVPKNANEILAEEGLKGKSARLKIMKIMDHVGWEKKKIKTSLMRSTIASRIHHD